MKIINLLIVLLCSIVILSCKKNTVVEPPYQKVYHKDGEVDTLIFNGKNAINVVVIGDGFTKDDLIKGGAYRDRIEGLFNYFFIIEPFRKYRKSFNVFIIYAESKTRGPGRGLSDPNSHTALDSYFYPQPSMLIHVSDISFGKYLNRAGLTNVHIKIAIVNDPEYRGTATNIAMITTNRYSHYVLVHEVGHTFANLGDEYISQSLVPNYPDSHALNYPNVDNTNDSAKIKWRHFFSKSSYQNVVGAFEGAYYRSKGFYRPEAVSIMGETMATHFNAPSREAIVKRIHDILKMPFDFDTFVKTDTASISPISTRASTGIRPLVGDFLNRRDIILEQKK